MSGAHFREVNLSRAKFRGVFMEGADIDGEITGLRVNGVDVFPLIEAELDRLHPERARLRPTTVEGLRESFATIERMWEPMLRRARERPTEEVNRSVDGEWSLVETLRHLIFATDSWFRNAVKGEPEPFHPLGLPFHPFTMDGLDLDARPDLETVLAGRAGRQAELREYAQTVTEEELVRERVTSPNGPWPPPESRTPLRCLQVILNEEWAHHRFVARDLAVIDAA